MRLHDITVGGRADMQLYRFYGAAKNDTATYFTTAETAIATFMANLLATALVRTIARMNCETPSGVKKKSFKMIKTPGCID